MKKKYPKVVGLRILLVGWLLYLLLIGPYKIVIALQGIPELIETKDTTAVADTAAGYGTALSRHRTVDGNKEAIPDATAGIHEKNTTSGQTSTTPHGTDFHFKTNTEKDTSHLFGILLLLSIGLHIILYRPLKIYFKDLRKGKKPDMEKRLKLQKKIHSVPLVQTLIFALPFAGDKIENLYMKYSHSTDSNLTGILYSQHYILVSAIAALVTIIFVYQWFQYNVQTKYLEHIIPEEQLIHREISFFKGKIRNRLWTSSLMTTFIPIFIVFIYLIVSVSTLPALSSDKMSPDVKTLLFGKMSRLIATDAYDEIPKWSIYFNLPNSMLMVFGMMSSMIISLIYVYFFIKWTTNRIVVPIRDLLGNMKFVQEGDFSRRTYIRTDDEMGRLTAGHNEMVEKLGIYVDDIKQLNTAYRRFVPQEFLDFLAKEKFSDIRLGDQVEKEMTILFTDIRNFTTISEQMTPQENFQFINDYLRFMEPVIIQNNGFIDKYIGDAIMALFPDSPDDALQAAVEMRQALKGFNDYKKNMKDIDTGIGIHTGRLMLGVIGGNNRMDGTVISDAVNLAARLEGLTKKYNKAIITSQETISKLKHKDKFIFEEIGPVQVKGKEKAVKVFSVVQ